MKHCDIRAVYPIPSHYGFTPAFYWEFIDDGPVRGSINEMLQPIWGELLGGGAE